MGCKKNGKFEENSNKEPKKEVKITNIKSHGKFKENSQPKKEVNLTTSKHHGKNKENSNIESKKEVNLTSSKNHGKLKENSNMESKKEVNITCSKNHEKLKENSNIEPKKEEKVANRTEPQCDEVEMESFQAPIEEVFGNNWWEVFCFPYILASRLWDCCASVCTGSNQCFIYWMVIQWLVCKITRLTTPDPVFFPYFFYVFAQVILLTLFFYYVWREWGRSVLIPYLYAYYEAWVKDDDKPVVLSKSTSRLSFRKYCFRKGDIFERAAPKNSSPSLKYGPVAMSLLIEMFLYDVLR